LTSPAPPTPGRLRPRRCRRPAAFVEPVHAGRRRGRRRRAEVDDDGFFHAGKLHHHEAAAADARRVRFEDAEGESGGDGRVDGVAAHLEDLDADTGRLGFRRGDDAVRARRPRP